MPLRLDGWKLLQASTEIDVRCIVSKVDAVQTSQERHLRNQAISGHAARPW